MVTTITFINDNSNKVLLETLQKYHFYIDTFEEGGEKFLHAINEKDLSPNVILNVINELKQYNIIIDSFQLSPYLGKENKKIQKILQKGVSFEIVENWSDPYFDFQHISVEITTKETSIEIFSNLLEKLKKL